MRVAHGRSLARGGQRLHVVRGIVVRIGRAIKAGVERLDEALEPGEAQMAIEAPIAHLLAPIEDVRRIAQPVRPALEILLIVNMRIDGIGHHQVRDVEVFAEGLQPNVAGGNEFMIVVPELCTDSLCECGCVRSGLAVVVRW